MNQGHLDSSRLYSLFGAWSDEEMDAFETAIRDGRTSDNTRQIVSFDEA